MIKVIASDLDGTLLGDDHKVAPETLKALRRAQDAGLRVIIVTGRNYHNAMQALEGIELSCDYVLASGAEVRNPRKEIVSRCEIEEGLCEEVYKILKRYPISIIFCTDEYDYQIGTPEEVEKSNILHLQLSALDMTAEEIIKTPMYQRAKKNTRIVPDFQELKKAKVPIFKLYLFGEDIKMLLRMKADLERIPQIAVSSSFTRNLEITDVRAQKGPVLKEYIEGLGYSMDEVMVFGDSLNDYSMLAMDFGATVAMGNADPEVKAAAKYVTKSNEELGVAWAVDELLARRSRKDYNKEAGMESLPEATAR